MNIYCYIFIVHSLSALVAVSRVQAGCQSAQHTSPGQHTLYIYIYMYMYIYIYIYIYIYRKTDSIHHHHHPEGVVYRNCCLNSSTFVVSETVSRRWWCIESLFPIHIYIYVYIYIYIYIQRERERERERDITYIHIFIHVKHICVYI